MQAIDAIVWVAANKARLRLTPFSLWRAAALICEFGKETSHGDESDEGRESCCPPPSLPAPNWKAMKAMNVPKKSMMASKKASMMVVVKASKTGALMSSRHVNTKGIEDIWVDAILISKRPHLESDNVILKIFKKDN